MGKTSLLTRLLENRILDDAKTTVGVRELDQQMERDGVALHVKYCDTAGHDNFRPMSQVYLNNAQGTHALNEQRYGDELMLQLPGLTGPSWLLCRSDDSLRHSEWRELRALQGMA